MSACLIFCWCASCSCKRVIVCRLKQLTLHSATRFQHSRWNHGRHEGNEEGYEEGGSSRSTKEGDEGHEEVRSCLSIAGRPNDQRPAVM